MGLEFEYEIHLVKDARYGSKDATGKWTGMIGELIRGVCVNHRVFSHSILHHSTPRMQTWL